MRVQIQYTFAVVLYSLVMRLAVLAGEADTLNDLDG
jgi:hypothetical protein